MSEMHPATSPVAPVVPVPAPDVPRKQSAWGYRILFYAAAVIAIATTAVAWNLDRKLAHQLHHSQVLKSEKDYPFIVEAYGFKYQGHSGNAIDDWILKYGAWEKDYLFFVRDYLKNLNEPNGVVIDVGSNTGHHTMFYSRHAGRVVAFEPFPPVIDIFKRNLSLNPDIKNIELYEVGLGDSNAELPFVAPPTGNHGQGSFRADTPQVPGMTKYDKKLQIVVGDEFLKDKNLGSVVFIKVDVEGFEEAVLKGLRQTIEKNRPMMEVEITCPPTGTIDTFDRLKALFPENYEFHVLSKSLEGMAKGIYHLESLDPSDLNKGQFELIACPKERAKLLPGR